MANTGWIFADFFLRQGLNIIVGIYVARYLLPEGLGSLSYATTYLQLLQPFAYIGLTAIVIRDLVKFKDDAPAIMGTAFVFKLCASIISFISILVIVYFLNNDSISKWYIVIASASLLISPLQVIDFYFQAQVKAKYIVYSQQISSVIISLLRLTGVFLAFNITWFVWMLLAETVVTSVMLILFYTVNKQQISLWKFEKHIAKRFLGELWPVIFSGFFIALYMRIDQLMIFEMLDAKSLGIYAAAVKLCEPFYVVATLICSSLFPAIVNGLEISRAEYEYRLQRLFNILTWLSIIASVFIHFTSPLIIKLIYGSEYDGAEVILQVYFWASILVFQGVVAGQAYVTEKLQLYGTLYTAIGAAINIGLNYILIPKMGVVGAAIATLVAYTFSATLLNALFKPTRLIFKQQILAFTAIFTKPKLLLQSFHVTKSNS